MVNYCWVKGCNRNSRANAQLKFYTLPKEAHRQIEWLKAIGREDILEIEKPGLISGRVCSRHFPATTYQRRQLAPDAVPSLFLPGSEDIEEEPKRANHSSIVCNFCNNMIVGFRYKCVTCEDYDLCSSCEMREIHSEHFMLRIPKPMKFSSTVEITKKWRQLFDKAHITAEDVDSTDDLDSDDEPIQRLISNKNEPYLSKELKKTIREKIKIALKDKNERRDNFEVVFADVNAVKDINEIQSDGKDHHGMEQDNMFGRSEIKNVVDNEKDYLDYEYGSTNRVLPRVEVKLSDNLKDFIIEVDGRTHST